MAMYLTLILQHNLAMRKEISKSGIRRDLYKSGTILNLALIISEQTTTTQRGRVDTQPT
jgi:hypothetical protein